MNMLLFFNQDRWRSQNGAWPNQKG